MGKGIKIDAFKSQKSRWHYLIVALMRSEASFICGGDIKNKSA